MDAQDEKAIVEKCKVDQKYFGQLFDAHYHNILRYCIRRTGELSLAEDITSETFIKAYKNISKFEWQGFSISAWFYKIANNEIRMYYRKHRHSLIHVSNTFIDIDDRVRDDIEALQSAIDSMSDYQRVFNLISNLSTKYQEVLNLRFVEEKKLSEIAYILNKKEGTVKSLLSRALEKLRIELDNKKMQPFRVDCIVLVEE